MRALSEHYLGWFQTSKQTLIQRPCHLPWDQQASGFLSGGDEEMRGRRCLCLKRVGKEELEGRQFVTANFLGRRNLRTQRSP